jgi:hypothetical protein
MGREHDEFTYHLCGHPGGWRSASYQRVHHLLIDRLQGPRFTTRRSVVAL